MGRRCRIRPFSHPWQHLHGHRHLAEPLLLLPNPYPSPLGHTPGPIPAVLLGESSIRTHGLIFV
jgi:hypothetical protein